MRDLAPPRSGSRVLGRLATASGWFGLAAWVVVAAWFAVEVAPERGVPARGAERERGVVVAVHRATADSRVVGGSSASIYYPVLEYGHAWRSTPVEQTSRCFLRDPPEVGSPVDVVYDALNAPCPAQGLRAGLATGGVRWPWALLGLGSAGLVLSAALARRARTATVTATDGHRSPGRATSHDAAARGIGPPVSLLAGLGIASSVASWLLPLSQRGEHPPRVDQASGTSAGTGDVTMSWAWQDPGSLLVLGGLVLLVAHMVHGRRTNSVIWLGPIGVVVGLVGLVVQQADASSDSNVEVVTGAGTAAAWFGLVALGVAVAADRLSRPPPRPALATSPPLGGRSALVRAGRAGMLAGALTGLLVACEVFAYVMLEGWADDTLSSGEKLQALLAYGLTAGAVVGAALGAVATAVTWSAARRETPDRALLAVRLAAIWVTAASLGLGSLVLVDNHGGWSTTNVLVATTSAGTLATMVVLARHAYRTR